MCFPPFFPVDLLFFHLCTIFLSLSTSNVGFLLFLRRVPSVRAFQKKNKSGGERPAENWFLGRGSKSGQNEMLAVFRWQTREVVLEYRVVPLRGGVFQVGLDLRGRIMLGMRLRRITFSRDFHDLTIRTGAFNCRDSGGHEAFSHNDITVRRKL